MKNLLLLLLTSFILYSCGSKCKKDALFENKFFKNISLIEEFFNYEDSLSNIDFESRIDSSKWIDEIKTKVWYATIYNSAITNIDFGQPEYANVDSIITLWKEWYKQNECYMTLKKADSIYFEKYEAWEIALRIFEIRVAEAKKKNPNYMRDDEEIYFIEDSIRKSRRK